MPREDRLKLIVRDVVSLAVFVVVAVGVGVALGIGLAKLTGSDDPATTDGSVGAASASAARSAETTTAPTRAPAASAESTQRPRAAPSRLAQVRFSVLDARLFTDGAPSGRQEQPARLNVRMRAENPGTQGVALEAPALLVGSVRTPSEPDADATGSQLQRLAAGASQTATLRFALGGRVTPKVVRDRRARVLVGGQSLPLRVKLQAPAG